MGWSQTGSLVYKSQLSWVCPSSQPSKIFHPLPIKKVEFYVVNNNKHFIQ